MKRHILILFIIFFSSLLYGQESKSTTILWDASLSMMNRNVEKEFAFLEDYFKGKVNVPVHLVIFAHQIIEEKQLRVSGTDLSVLQQKLRAITYDGATAYSMLGSKVVSGSEVLMFTDGQSKELRTGRIFNGNGIIINSVMDNDDILLKQLVGYNQATLINLSEVTTKHDGDPSTESALNTYTGTIYVDDQPALNAEVQHRYDTPVLFTNEQGEFSILGNKGDTLYIAYKDYKTSYILEEEFNFSVLMSTKGELLNEVVVVGVAKKNEESTEAPKKRTAYGDKNPDRVGYAVQSIEKEDIADTSTDLSKAIKGKFSGVRYSDVQDATQAVIRGGTGSLLLNNYALIVLDGVPMRRSESNFGGSVESSMHIDPASIESVTVLKGLAATNRYGSEGAGGVIVINTKGYVLDNTNSEKPLTILNKNVYDDKKIRKGEKEVPVYIQKLNSFKTLAEAYNYYLTSRFIYLEQPDYFFDVYDFFKATDQKLANRVLSNVLEVFSDRTEVLKALAFKRESENNFVAAAALYARVLKRNKKSSQAYLDYMNTAFESGIQEEIAKAKEMLLKITNNKWEEQVDFTGIKKTFTNDIRNVLRKKSTPLTIKEGDLPSPYFFNTTYDARIVLSWNNPHAEFTIQFVNPLKRFSTWEHTEQANGIRIQSEKEQGFYTEEFQINAEIKELKGEWLLNLKDHNSMEGESSQYRITIYKNFGKDNQSQKTLIYSPAEKGAYATVLKFRI